MERQELIKKIEQLPPDRLSELEEFVESLELRGDCEYRNELHRDLAEYAQQHAGTGADLDGELESASAEYLLQMTPQ